MVGLDPGWLISGILSFVNNDIGGLISGRLIMGGGG